MTPAITASARIANSVAAIVAARPRRSPLGLTKASTRAPGPLGERDRGVVAGRQQQPVQHHADADPAAALEHPDARARVRQRLLGDRHLGALRHAVGHHQRGHHLGQRRDRQHPVGPVPPEHLPAVDVEQQPGPRRPAEAHAHGVRAAESWTASGDGAVPPRPAGRSRSRAAAGRAPRAGLAAGGGPGWMPPPGQRVASRPARARSRPPPASSGDGSGGGLPGGACRASAALVGRLRERAKIPKAISARTMRDRTVSRSGPSTSIT